MCMIENDFRSADKIVRKRKGWDTKKERDEDRVRQT